MTVLCAGHTIALAHWHTCCPHESDAEYEQRRASIAKQCQLCESPCDTWDNETRPQGAVNTLRPLTHSLDSARRG